MSNNIFCISLTVYTWLDLIPTRKIATIKTKNKRPTTAIQMFIIKIVSVQSVVSNNICQLSQLVSMGNQGMIKVYGFMLDHSGSKGQKLNIHWPFNDDIPQKLRNLMIC